MIAAITERVGIVRILEHHGRLDRWCRRWGERATGLDRRRWAVTEGGRLDTASERLDGQGRGASDDRESGVDGALESVKAASREHLRALARARTAEGAALLSLCATL